MGSPPGPSIITTATWRRCKNFSQWKCKWKLRCRWLKFLRQRQINAVVYRPLEQSIHQLSLKLSNKPYGFCTASKNHRILLWTTYIAQQARKHDSKRTNNTKHENRDDFVNVPSQWETTLHCNVVFQWLGAYTKRSLGNIVRCRHNSKFSLKYTQ